MEEGTHEVIENWSRPVAFISGSNSDGSWCEYRDREYNPPTGIRSVYGMGVFHERKRSDTGQCLEKRVLGYWANLSDGQKTSYAEIKVLLPDFHKFEQDTSAVSALATDASSQDEKAAAVIAYMSTANSAT
jgi:hypothetical protein